MDEKLQDIISIICLLEADMEMEKAEEVHLRTVKVIHRLLIDVMEEQNAQSVENKHLM